MWQTISNVSAVVTCFLFILYIIGHIWKVIITRQTRFEKFQIQRFESEDEMAEHDKVLILDRVGEVFSLSSEYGIRNVTVYHVEYDFDNEGKPYLKSKRVKDTYGKLGVNEQLFIRCNLGEVMSIIQFEIERADYTKVTFDVTTSGKTGNIIINNILDKNYKFQMTFKSFLYYLCV